MFWAIFEAVVLLKLVEKTSKRVKIFLIKKPVSVSWSVQNCYTQLWEPCMGVYFLGVHVVWSIFGPMFNKKIKRQSHKKWTQKWTLQKIHPHICFYFCITCVLVGLPFSPVFAGMDFSAASVLPPPSSGQGSSTTCVTALRNYGALSAPPPKNKKKQIVS